MDRPYPNTDPASSESDEALLGRIAQGDADAFAFFYDRHAGILMGIAIRILGNSEEAEDVLQEALVLLWERASLYQPDLGKPLSWAITLTRNKAIDRLRARQRRPDLLPAVAEQVPERAADGPPSRCLAELEEQNRLIRIAVATLPHDQKVAIELAFFGGLTHQEVAERTSAPLGTVKARIRRGMLTLRDGLEGCL